MDTFFNIFGTLIGVALSAALIYGGVRSRRDYLRKKKNGQCIEGSDKAFATLGTFGAIVAGIALFVFIITQWV